MEREKWDPVAFRQRLRQALDAAGMSPTALERSGAVGKGYASRLLSGDRGKRIDVITVRRIANKIGVNYAWLATGEGEMGIVPDTDTERRALVRINRDRYPWSVLAKLYEHACAGGCPQHSKAFWIERLAEAVSEDATNAKPDEDRPAEPAGRKKKGAA